MLLRLLRRTVLTVRLSAEESERFHQFHGTIDTLDALKIPCIRRDHFINGANWSLRETVLGGFFQTADEYPLSQAIRWPRFGMATSMPELCWYLPVLAVIHGIVQHLLETQL